MSTEVFQIVYPSVLLRDCWMVPTLDSNTQADIECFPWSPVDSSKPSICIICSSLKVLAISESVQGDFTELC